MTARTIRDEVLHAWAEYFIREGCARPVANTLALTVERIMIGHGAPGLPNRPRPENSNAVALADRPVPGDATAGAAAVRAQLQPYAGIDRRHDHEPDPNQLQLPEEPE